MQTTTEREGFEPPVSCPTIVFKTTAFDHSAISPRANDYKSKTLYYYKQLTKKSPYVREKKHMDMTQHAYKPGSVDGDHLSLACHHWHAPAFYPKLFQRAAVVSS